MGPPAVSSKDILERYLAKRGLELLIHINELDYPFMSLLMAYFSEGNPEISRMVIGKRVVNCRYLIPTLTCTCIRIRLLHVHVIYSYSTYLHDMYTHYTDIS